MTRAFLLQGGAQLPTSTCYIGPQQFGDIRSQAFDIDDWVAAEHLGQAVGQVTDQTLAGPLVQVQIKTKRVAGGVIAAVAQGNVV